jgi:hypothetical protein
VPLNPTLVQKAHIEMRVLLPLRKHANKHDDDDDDFLILVDSDSEDGPQYIVHSLPEAAAALADPSSLADKVLFRPRKHQAAVGKKQGEPLVAEEVNVPEGGKQKVNLEYFKEVCVKRNIPSTVNSSDAGLQSSQRSQLAAEQEHEGEIDSLEVAKKDPPGASYKTTGLETEETLQVSKPLGSRKRQAHSICNEDLNSVAPNPVSLLPDSDSTLDQKPAARKVSKVHHSGPRNMVCRGSSRRNYEQWGDFHHPGDEPRQGAEDTEESPEMMGAEVENNPESARGDVSFGLSMVSNNLPVATGMEGITQYPSAATASPSPTPREFAPGRASPSSFESVASTSSGGWEFLEVLKKRGLEIRQQDGDGNCLFRAVSLQIYGDPSMHGDIRKQCMDFMVSPPGLRWCRSDLVCQARMVRLIQT